ncbi:ATP-binding cassette sub-family A member 9-like [Otolemur garnettii]|uniref:ATP-binding cassette sub-family A member 9-like n=1 Tax=Otolemur garnettii TaxID=30611 RepID=UPI00064472F1|nr:ATP-binding cassette sub-family A member 9-like [Otolemur garnettii]XP_012669536.1 ATP-binding cassette sub-family A member 9-like [Otolemur garnettii]
MSPDSMDYLGESESQIVYLALLLPYLQFFLFFFILRCLEKNFRKEGMRNDPVFRISPKSSDVFPNLEEPEVEDEDVQMERTRTANAVTVTDTDEVEVTKMPTQYSFLSDKGSNALILSFEKHLKFFHSYTQSS